MIRKLRRACYYIRHNRAQFCDSLVANLLFWLPDEPYLRLRFRFKMGYWPNLTNPYTFVEKINWLKLHDRKPEYTMIVDKYAVKEYVASKIGEKYVIPTLGVWDNVKDIDWDSLPDQFVLKTTHGGGSCGVVVCKNKHTFDRKQACMQLADSMGSSIYKNLREWPYKNVRKRVIAEKFMIPKEKVNDPTYDLTDYKFFCFGGEPCYCQVIRDRHTRESIDFYDMEWNHQNFVGLNPKVICGTAPIAKPVCLELMKDICRTLSANIPFLRVDLYVIDGKVYFGELTFYPASGIGMFKPKEWDEKFGKMIDLPNID